MRSTLSGRTAIVTGASHGIGAAVSRALSRAGASVVLAARDLPALDAVAADISAAGGHAVAVPTDLTSPVSVRRLVEQARGAFGRFDTAVNTEGVALAMKYLIPSMRCGGRIVNLAPHAAVLELTRAAALDVAASAVRINAVAAHGSEAEIAAVIVRLCSDDAFGTGETLHVGHPLWTPTR